MKTAYISVVLTAKGIPSTESIAQIDFALSRVARRHEIIVAESYYDDVFDFDEFVMEGPVTVVTSRMRATQDQVLLAGLARAVGDFVIEWRGQAFDLDSETLQNMLEPTDSGIELVEVAGTVDSLTSRLFLRLVNSMRPRTVPVLISVGRTYSRHALQQLLNTSTHEPQVDVIAAELPVRRSVLHVYKPSLSPRFRNQLSESLTLLSRGTRFGTTFPLSLAVLSTCFGVGAAIYSLALFLISGQTPEGWTTLMVLVGLGQAAILSMLAFTWSRISALTRGLSNDFDSTARVRVFAPKQGDRK